jgi:hypothetical protein
MQYSLSLIKGKNKWSLGTPLWMSIWGCSSPVTYCQPAAAPGFIYCRSQEWALLSPSPAGFVNLEFSWMHAPFVFSSIQPYSPVAIAVLFYLESEWGGAPPLLSSGACHTLAAVGCLLFSKHTGEVVPLLPSQASLFIYSSGRGASLLPLSRGAFLKTATVTSFPCSKVAGRVPPLLPSLAGLFIYSSGRGSAPPPVSRAQGALPSLLRVFFFSCLFITQVFFSFYPGQGSVCLGGCAAYLLTWWSPRQVRRWRLTAQEPSWFLH